MAEPQTIPPQIAAYIQRHRDHHVKKGGGGGQAQLASASPAPAGNPPTAGAATPGPAATAAGTRPVAPAAPAPAAATDHAQGAKDNKDKTETMFDGHPPSNPFDAPAAQVEIEKLSLPIVRQLAVAQAQNARGDFSTALEKVRAARKAKTEEDQKHREQMCILVITVALLPAGPLIAAAANMVAAEKVRNGILEAIVNNAGTLETKFGAGGAAVANKMSGALASKAVDKLVEKFSPEKAKKALEAGVDKLKDKAVKFAANSDEGKCVNSFLDALMKSANDAMHNLTDLIGTMPSYSEAVAYYNMFSQPLQASYEAAINQQVEHMLRQMKDVLAHNGEPQTISTNEFGGVATAADEVVRIDMKGRKMLAHVVRLDNTYMNKPMYSFRAWITPDMQASAVKLVKEEVSVEQLQGGVHVPEPEREPGERVVLVSSGGKDRLMLIDVEDKNGFFSSDYGVQTFKQWAESEEDERVFRTLGASQIGKINKVDVKTIRNVPKA